MCPNRNIKGFRYQICLIMTLSTTIFLISIILLFRSFHAEQSEELPLAAESIDQSLPDPYNLKLKHENNTIHHIYIDIGCFNGETIEHFIYFMPDSATYDIITFEPEPTNYELCKKSLKQKKYENYSITILPHAAWIRNEQVFFQINRGRLSRINGNILAVNNVDVKQVDGIDFSSWLTQFWKPNRTQIYLKMSLPGAEIPVLEKMILDDTIDFIYKYEVEWTDRDNPNLRSPRIYIQLMFDSRGFDTLYYTRLHDARLTYKHQGSLNDVKKYYDWKKIEESDTFAHYRQRPEEAEMLRRTFRKKVKF